MTVDGQQASIPETPNPIGFTVGRDVTVHEGDWVTLDGATGNVYLGDLPTVPSEIVRVLGGQMLADRAPTYRAFSRVLGDVQWPPAPRWSPYPAPPHA